MRSEKSKIIVTEDGQSQPAIRIRNTNFIAPNLKASNERMQKRVQA